MSMVHFLRPYWLLCFIPLLLLTLRFNKQSLGLQYWKQACDEHLLPYLINSKSQLKSYFFIFPLLSLLFMIIGLSGPAFVKLPVPIYQHQQAHVLILDLSNSMLANDIKPNRLQRAKFKLRDLLRSKKTLGQLGLIVYSGEPFVASPLTDDGKTIDALMDVLTPDIMPVAGNHLETALEEGYQLIQQSGQAQGSILVLTAESPTPQAIKTAENIAKKQVSVSILPIIPIQHVNSMFTQFAQAGQGQMISFTETSADIFHWLSATKNIHHFKQIEQDTIPQWRDDGRWFLIPAVLLLLPLFRQGTRSWIIE